MWLSFIRFILFKVSHIKITKIINTVPSQSSTHTENCNPSNIESFNNIKVKLAKDFVKNIFLCVSRIEIVIATLVWGMISTANVNHSSNFIHRLLTMLQIL